MSYAAAIDQLNAMAPELYARPGQPRRKFSLGEVRILLDALGNPHRNFPSVLIAGTNGKGLDSLYSKFHFVGGGTANRALYFAAPGKTE